MSRSAWPILTRLEERLVMDDVAEALRDEGNVTGAGTAGLACTTISLEGIGFLEPNVYLSQEGLSEVESLEPLRVVDSRAVLPERLWDSGMGEFGSEA